MERILLDTDIGSDVDDAHALVFALKSPDLSLEGVTTVYGKTDVRAKIARKLLDYAGRSDVPVHAGHGTPFVLGPHDIWHTGREGEGVLSNADYALPLQAMSIGETAVNFLVERIMARPGEYNLVTIGALTNVAKAIQQEPRVVDNIKRMYIMGGKVSRTLFGLDDCFGEDDSPEHNIACDIQAAQRVFATPIPKTVLPINVTALVPITREAFEQLRTGHPADEALYALTKVWFDYRDQGFGHPTTFTCMHDPLTVAAVNYPDLLKSVSINIAVDDKGCTRLDARGMPVTLCYDVDASRFETIFLDTMVRPLPDVVR